jgi:hypothetical protein
MKKGEARRNDGTMEMVDDYVLADDEEFTHSLTFMDGMDNVQLAATRGLGLHDGMGNPAAHKPRYVFCWRPGEAYRFGDEVAREAARQEMIDAALTAWIGKPRTRKERRERQIGSRPATASECQ